MPSASRPSRGWLALVGLLVVALGCLAVGPAAAMGVALCLAVFSLAWPIGTTLAVRVFGALIALMAEAGVLFVALPIPLDRWTAQAFLILNPAVLLAMRRKPGGLEFPRTDVLSLISLTAGLVGGATAWSAFAGLSPTIVLARLRLGWDFQSHFSMFADLYHYGHLTFLQVAGSAEFMSSPPLLHPAIWATLQWAGQSGTQAITGAALLPDYVLQVALMFGFCVAALAFVAGDLAALFVTPRRSLVPSAIAATLVLAYCVYASPMGLFLIGHTAFLFGITVVVLASDLALRHSADDERTGWWARTLIAITAVVVVALEWPPLLLGMVPMGIGLARHLIHLEKRPGKLVWAAVAVVGLAAAALADLLISKIGLGVLAIALGGNAPFDEQLALVSIPLGLLAGIVLSRRYGWDGFAAVGGPGLGALAFGLLLLANGARLTGRRASYYLVKILHGALLMSLPALVALVVSGIWLLALIAVARRDRGIGLTITAAIFSVIIIGVTLTPSPSTALLSGSRARASLSRAPVVEAARIISAERAVPLDPLTIPIIWSDRDLLSNRWLVSLHRAMTQRDSDLQFAYTYSSRAADAEAICAFLERVTNARIVVLVDHQRELSSADRQTLDGCAGNRITIRHLSVL